MFTPSKILHFLCTTSKVVVIGNGFDQDLGLKTNYNAFWEDRQDKLTSFRYLLNDGTRLFSQLEEYSKKSFANNWCDLEEIIRTYASITYKRNESPVESILRSGGYHNENYNANIAYFNLLKEEIVSYLNVQQNGKINITSKAAELLKWMRKTKKMTCYNFNYTDVNAFADSLGYKGRINVKYIHGNLRDKNIILGVGKDKLVEGYDFLLKNNQGALEMAFIEDLLKADEIVIFGLAFGRNDIHYFTDLFRQIQNDVIKPRITIYTYNEIEKQNIRNRLTECGIDLTAIIAKTKLTLCSTH